MDNLDEKFLQHIISRLDTVETLSFIKCCVAFDSANWLKHLMPCKNLKFLKLVRCCDNWGTEKEYLKGATFTNLEEIFVERSDGFDDELVEILSTKFPFLRKLTIRSGDNNISFDAVDKHLTKLRNLGLLRLLFWNDMKNEEKEKIVM